MEHELLQSTYKLEAGLLVASTELADNHQRLDNLDDGLEVLHSSASGVCAGARSLWAEVDRTEKISAEGGSGSVVTGGGSRRPSVAASAAVGLGDLSRWDANTGEEEEEEHVQQM